MTKITTYNRGIIIDGHADTKEECETITLLCNSLAKDKNFKQVAYDDGYAAFQKVGKAERLRFAPADPVEFSETWELNPAWHGNSYNFTGLAFRSNGEMFSSIKVVGDFGNDAIYYDDKYIVNCQDDDYVDWKVDLAYATITLLTPPTADLLTWLQANGTKQSTPKLSVDLTTLSGWANLSAGNHTIKIKAKGTGYRDSELSVGVTVSKIVTLSAGTYKWNDSVSLIDIDQDIEFTSNNTQYTIIKSNEGRAVITYTTSYMAAVYNNGTWTNEAYKTITLSTDQQVSQEFYNWAITQGNLVKQAGYKLTLQLMAFQQDQDPSNAYIKINSDTVSSTDYDYMIQGSPSSIFDKNGVRIDASSALVITGVYKVAWRGAYSAYLIGEDTPQIVGSQYTLSTYELSGDTTLQIRYEYSGSLSSPANTEEPTI